MLIRNVHTKAEVRQIQCAWIMINSIFSLFFEFSEKVFGICTDIPSLPTDLSSCKTGQTEVPRFS